MLLRTRPALRALRAITLLVTACAVLAGVVLGGTRYFYCAPMQAVMAAPCCDHRAATGDAPAVRDLFRCCEARTLDAVPPATADGDVMAVPPVALIERIATPAVTPPRAQLAITRPILDVRRTGPPPPRLTSTVLLI